MKKTILVTILAGTLGLTCGARGETMRLSLRAASEVGTPIQSVMPGETFQLHVLAEDIRPEPRGVFAAHIDLQFSPGILELNGPVTFGPDFPNAPRAEVREGSIVGAGAVGSDTVGKSNGGDPMLLLSVPFRVTGNNRIEVSVDPHVATPFLDSLVLGINGRLPASEILSGQISLSVVSPSPGDANGDGEVDLTDFSILKTHFGSDGSWREGDFSGNGRIDLADFTLLKDRFGSRSMAVPESTTGALLLAALPALMLGLFFQRRGRGAGSPCRR